jgi:predicted dehydrogenase
LVTRWHPAGNAEIRVALFGAGTMGRNHARVLQTIEGIRLVAVADADPDAARAAAGTFGIRHAADPFELLDTESLHAVVIATPTTTHTRLAIEALDRGLAVLVEKPLAPTVDEALAIHEKAGETGAPVAVGHVERHNPAVLELGRRLREGWLSSVYAIASRRAGPFPARIRDVGVTVDLATHDVDILSWIAGERPSRVYAETAQRLHATHEDLLYGTLHFPSGITGMIDVNWLTPAKRRQLTVVGEEGMFELDYLTQRLTFTRSDISQPRLIRGYASTFEGDVAVIEVDAVEPLGAELRDFIDAVRVGRRPTVSVEDGVWAVAIANALLDAARTRVPVDLHELPLRLPVR